MVLMRSSIVFFVLAVVLVSGFSQSTPIDHLANGAAKGWVSFYVPNEGKKAAEKMQLVVYAADDPGGTPSVDLRAMRKMLVIFSKKRGLSDSLAEIMSFGQDGQDPLRVGKRSAVFACPPGRHGFVVCPDPRYNDNKVTNVDAYLKYGLPLAVDVLEGLTTPVQVQVLDFKETSGRSEFGAWTERNGQLAVIVETPSK